MDNPEPQKPEVYTWGYSSDASGHMARRSAARQAAFFLPHLRPGMRLLDCGCGPGTITVGLAEAVSPGQTVGIDVEASQLDLARSHAGEQGVSGVLFEQANIYELHFGDASFDAAFFHTVLSHVSDPVRALREVHRVLRSGGVVGMREFDESGLIHYPSNPIAMKRYELVYKVWRQNGGDPALGRKLRQVLREAGFARSEGSASCEYYGTSEDTGYYGEGIGKSLVSPESMDEWVEAGLVEREELEEIGASWREWGMNPDAFIARVHCEAVGWKD